MIALSSQMGQEEKKCREAGFDGFLSKPVRRKKLYQLLDRMLGKRRDGDKKDEAEAHKIMSPDSIREKINHAVRVLLVEDNPVNRKPAGLMLTKAGYQVEMAHNGLEAVRKFTEAPKKYDLIFMDIQMPQMDGTEATKAIREKGFDAIPIVAMTAHAMKGDREKFLKAGMTDYLTKPIRREEIFSTIRKWVS